MGMDDRSYTLADMLAAYEEGAICALDEYKATGGMSFEDFMVSRYTADRDEIEKCYEASDPMLKI